MRTKARNRIFTLANMLSMLRILIAPVMVGCFYFPHPGLSCAIIFSLASFTDWLDGYLARNHDQASLLGEVLDPVADKIIVSTSLVLLVSAFSNILITIPAILIISREIIVSAIRELALVFGRKKRIKVAFMGKIKTATQMTAIILLFLLMEFPACKYLELGFITLWIALGLSVLSAARYIAKLLKT